MLGSIIQKILCKFGLQSTKNAFKKANQFNLKQNVVKKHTRGMISSSYRIILRYLFPVGDRQLSYITLDITERKNLERELQKHKGHLEELVAERTQQLEQALQVLELSLNNLER